MRLDTYKHTQFYTNTQKMTSETDYDHITNKNSTLQLSITVCILTAITNVLIDKKREIIFTNILVHIYIIYIYIPTVTSSHFISTDEHYLESISSTNLKGKCPLRPLSSPSHTPFSFCLVTLIKSPA